MERPELAAPQLEGRRRSREAPVAPYQPHIWSGEEGFTAAVLVNVHNTFKLGLFFHTGGETSLWKW